MKSSVKQWYVHSSGLYFHSADETESGMKGMDEIH